MPLVVLVVVLSVVVVVVFCSRIGSCCSCYYLCVYLLFQACLALFRHIMSMIPVIALMHSFISIAYVIEHVTRRPVTLIRESKQAVRK